MKISIGNSTHGYDQANVTLINNKLRLIGDISGNQKLVKKAIANYNRGNTFVSNSADDCLPINLMD